MRDHRFDWVYLFGAVCPERGTGAALAMPCVNVDAMNKHLAEISACVTLGSIALLVIDGAGWHRTPSLDVPDNIVVLTLPPYAPELNPVEQIWAYLRANKFCHRVWDTYDDILDATCAAWNDVIATPEVIRSIATRKWAQVMT